MIMQVSCICTCTPTGTRPSVYPHWVSVSLSGGWSVFAQTQTFKINTDEHRCSMEPSSNTCFWFIQKRMQLLAIACEPLIPPELD